MAIFSIVLVAVGLALVIGLYYGYSVLSEKVDLRRLRNNGRTIELQRALEDVIAGHAYFVIDPAKKPCQVWYLKESTLLDGNLEMLVADNASLVVGVSKDQATQLINDSRIKGKVHEYNSTAFID